MYVCDRLHLSEWDAPAQWQPRRHTCTDILTAITYSAVSLVVVEVEYLINEEWPGNIVLLTYIHTCIHTYSTYIFTYCKYIFLCCNHTYIHTYIHTCINLYWFTPYVYYVCMQSCWMHCGCCRRWWTYGSIPFADCPTTPTFSTRATHSIAVVCMYVWMYVFSVYAHMHVCALCLYVCM